MNSEESVSINGDVKSAYGSFTLTVFTPEAINAKKQALTQALSFKRECLSIAMFSIDRGLSLSAALCCCVALALVVPAVISLLVLKFYTPLPVTVSDFTFATASEARQLIRERDANLLWAALGLALAGSLALFLYCIAGSLHSRLRDKKIQIQSYLSELDAVPALKPDDAEVIVVNAKTLLDDIEARLHPHELNESSMLLASP